MMYAVHHFVIGAPHPGRLTLLMRPTFTLSFTGSVLVYLDNTKVNGI